MDRHSLYFSRIFIILSLVGVSGLLLSACGLSDPKVVVHEENPVAGTADQGIKKDEPLPTQDPLDDPSEPDDEAAALTAFEDAVFDFVKDDCSDCHTSTEIAGGTFSKSAEDDRALLLEFMTDGDSCDPSTLVDKLEDGHGGGEKPDFVAALPDWTDQEPSCS